MPQSDENKPSLFDDAPPSLFDEPAPPATDAAPDPQPDAPKTTAAPPKSKTAKELASPAAPRTGRKTVAAPPSLEPADLVMAPEAETLSPPEEPAELILAPEETAPPLPEMLELSAPSDAPAPDALFTTDTRDEPNPPATNVEPVAASDPQPSASPSRRVALVTGASRGIGRGIAVELARLGFAVVVNYAGNETAAHECLGLVREAGGDGVICQGDISVEADRERLLAETLAAYGRIDLLVNNAGVAPTVRADILDASPESFDRLININLKGPYFLTQLVARQMIAQADREGGATPAPQIITISSVSAYAASTNRGDYCISKAGLSMMTALWAARLAPYGIGVYEVRPGIIATAMTGGVREKYDQMIADGVWPIKRWGEPSDVGRAVAAIARGDFPFSTGEVFNVDGGFHLRTL